MHRAFSVTLPAVVLALLLTFAPVVPAFAGGLAPTSPIDTPWTG